MAVLVRLIRPFSQSLVYVDEVSCTLLEKGPKDLLGSNLLSHMITLSKAQLGKLFGPNLFDIWAENGSRNFSFTIYSTQACEKYYYALQTGNINNTMKDDIFYKYFKCLEAQMLLIDLTEEGVLDKINSLWCFQNAYKDEKYALNQSKYAWLLFTRVSNHIQNLRYDLIRQYDRKIILQERRAAMLLDNQK